MATLYNGYQADHGEATCLTVLAQVMIEGQLTPVSQSGDGMPRWAMTKPWYAYALLCKQCDHVHAMWPYLAEQAMCFFWPWLAGHVQPWCTD